MAMVDTVHPTWAEMVFVVLCLVLLFGFLAWCAFLVLGGKRSKPRAIAVALPGCPQRSTAPEVRPLPVSSPGQCPVCGAALPGDLPEALCPQCLMQCALSRSDAETPDGAKAATAEYA